MKKWFHIKKRNSYLHGILFYCIQILFLEQIGLSIIQNSKHQTSINCIIKELNGCKRAW